MLDGTVQVGGVTQCHQWKSFLSKIRKLTDQYRWYFLNMTLYCATTVSILYHERSAGIRHTVFIKSNIIIKHVLKSFIVKRLSLAWAEVITMTLCY